jgi:hypothetical protein
MIVKKKEERILEWDEEQLIDELTQVLIEYDY